jgi:chemotaxis protein MotB
MTRKSAAIPHASQTIEDLLKESTFGTNQQGWLLSYLDVFILIVMLLITLKALTDISAVPVNQATHDIAPGAAATIKQQPEPQPQNQTTHPPLAPYNEAVLNTKTESSATNWINVADTGEEMIFIFAPLKNAAVNIDPDFKYIFELSAHPEPEQAEPPALPTAATQAQQSQTSAKEPSSEPDTLQMNSDTIQKTDAVSESVTQQQTNALTEQQHNDAQRQKSINEKLAKLQLDELISMEVKQGYAQLQIQDNILFEVAKAELTQQGKSLLQRLLPLLQQSVGLIFIEGHTDDRPIATNQFPSNWELSSARATSVLRFLASQQLAKNRLRAVSYADTMPIADNDTEEGRSQNRRVSILLRIPDEEL